MKTLIITPLPVEFDAVCNQLHAARKTCFVGQEGYEETTFDGLFHRYTILLREPGMKNVEMALATEKAIQHFKPDLVLLIGIAGGVKDVAIGDILVARKVYGYESGKEDADGFKARPAVESFSGELLARAQALSRRPDWKKRTGDGAEGARVFLGPIAAGDKVVAGVDNPSYQRIKTHYNDTLALEMEAIGFATALQGHRAIHGLVIRGISDLCAGKSITDQQNWQAVAAQRAAAFAFELLFQLDASSFIAPIMDTKTLAREIIGLLFPVPESIREIGNDFANAANNDIRAIWKKIKPLFIEELKDLADNPDDPAAKGALEMKLRKAVERDPTLQTDLSALWEQSVGTDKAGMVIKQKNVVMNSTINAGGDVRLGDDTKP
ncbi:MAG: 5'-methylthioadenosine/S-adenosylhomocysteine nucleosidase [Saprospiraceae bacterium]|nr:5'-methylthioadenosine/S-adenosylhomocysteine nucleosidase [Lewinellaceae bacterium]